MLNKKIASVIVLYHPDTAHLNSLIDELQMTINLILLVDNTPNCKNEFLSKKAQRNPGHLEYISLMHNKGIAYAQNVGIEAIIKHSGFEFIVFFDQDSTPDCKLVNSLYNSFIELNSGVFRIAAVAPVKVNKETKLPYKPKYTTDIDYLNKYSIRQVASNSGMMISIYALKEVGLMESELFIDFVDYEWCWRANAKNFKIIIVKDLFMQHMLGEGDKRVLFWVLKISKPIRTYYQFRNGISMLRRSYVPASFKSRFLVDLVVKYFVFCLLIKPRKAYLKYMTKGLIDGVFRFRINI